MVRKQLRKYPTSLVIREMPTKATRFQFTTIRIAEIKKSEEHTCSPGVPWLRILYTHSEIQSGSSSLNWKQFYLKTQLCWEVVAHT